MNQTELIRKIAEATELTQAAAGQALKAMVSVILDATSEGEPVRVFGFGSFAVTKHPARLGRNPRTGENITIAARSVLRFNPSRSVKDALNPPAPLKNPTRNGRRCARP